MIADAESVDIFPDVELLRDLLHRRRRIAVAIAVTLTPLVVLASLHQIILLPLLLAFVYAYIAIILATCNRPQRFALRQAAPLLRLTPQGIEVCVCDGIGVYAPGWSTGLLRWEEIAAIRPYRMFRGMPPTFLGIAPHNTWKVARQVGGMRGLRLRLIALHMTIYVRPFGFAAPINVPESCLPRPAVDIAKEIATYRAAVGK